MAVDESYRGILVNIADSVTAQSPDTGQIPLNTLLPAGLNTTRVCIKSIWFDFVSSSAAGTRDMGVEIRTPITTGGVSAGTSTGTLHVFSLFPSTSQPASKTWIWTIAPGLQNFASAAGNSICAPWPDNIWLPPQATFELDSTGPSGAQDKFTNINLFLAVE